MRPPGGENGTEKSVLNRTWHERNCDFLIGDWWISKTNADNCENRVGLILPTSAFPVDDERYSVGRS